MNVQRFSVAIVVLILALSSAAFGQGTVVRCSSDDGKRHSCAADTRGGVQLSRQISGSACIQASTWGFDDRGIWVDRGCRAEFTTYPGIYPAGAIGATGTISCAEHTGFLIMRCPADTSRGVQLVRQISASACTYNSTWGYDANSIWVSRGCRAEFALGGSGAAVAAAAGQTFTCSSDDGQRHSCPADTRGGVQLTRQISGSPCTHGSTWGFSETEVWVDRGCRAEFTTYPGVAVGSGTAAPGTVTCSERTGFLTTRCAADTSRGVRLARQLSGSPCTYTATWGYESGQIWVSKGCRAEFAVGATAGVGGQTITCSSNDGRRHTCPANTRGGVQLTRQISGSACTLGSTWGFDAQGVWVDRGCRAEFTVGQ